MSLAEWKTLFEDVFVIKVVSGVAGATVSLRFIPGVWYERVAMFFGGVFCSLYGADVIASYLDMGQKATGLVGFLVGIFGMALISKIYEGITSLDAKRLAGDAWDWLMRKPPKEKE